MRKTIFSCAFLLSVSAACAVVSVGCSGDDNTDEPGDSGGSTTDASKDTGTGHDATVDANKPDTGGNVDSGGDDDTGTPDTSVPDTSTPDTGAHDGGTDTGTHDGGSDTGTQDAGTDTGAHDSGSDTGTQDAGTDTGTQDAGTDTGTQDSGTDSGTDSGSDASTDSGSDASTNSFDNPVQIDVTTVLTANTVLTTTPLPTGLLLSSMDKTQEDFFTQSKASQLGSYKGLPDDATFPAVVGVHPFVKLHWNNLVDQLNSRVVQDATPFVFPVAPANYTQVQIFGLSTEGNSTVHVVLTYSDASTSAGVDLVIADWFGTSTADQFPLITGMNRIANSITVDSRTNPAIYGSNVPPDPTKKVTGVTVTNNGPGYFVFYGAVAY